MISIIFSLYEKLGQLKNNNSALHVGKNAASYVRISTSHNDKVLAFIREKDKNQVIFVANMTKELITFRMDYNGKFKDYTSGKEVVLKPEDAYSLGAWEFLILVEE